eukprot:TRINITY_DN1837_c0_g1_i1.p1 TRINITY_DN1837_c0_g1~~TRINITY_DN1837_c0_g1_i1.p1  ORF type:complete len:201 (+),score=27.19 TRINITY_DN1837_c0_g1_i1:192-794(+)
MTSYSICILGEGGVGKSALSIRYVSGNFIADYDPTIENSYRRQDVVDEVSCLVNIIDTAGQEQYAVLRDHYINQADGYICVYSILSRTSFAALTDIYEQILRVRDTYSVPLVLVGTKKDLEAQRAVSWKEGNDYSKSLAESTAFFETSAKSGESVDDVFREAVRLVRKYPIARNDALPRVRKRSLTANKIKTIQSSCILQ